MKLEKTIPPLHPRKTLKTTLIDISVFPLKESKIKQMKYEIRIHDLSHVDAGNRVIKAKAITMWS